MARFWLFPVLVIAVAAVSSPTTLGAQSRDVDVVVAALEHVVDRLSQAESLVERPVRFDSRILEAQGAARWTVRTLDEQRFQDVLARTRTYPGPFDDLRRCPGPSPRECYLVDTSIALATSEPVFRASGATVVVHAIFMTHDARQPVHQAAWEYVLEYGNDAWTVVTVRALSAS